MSNGNGKVRISICMGSSCFGRGNGHHLELLQTYFRRNGLEGRVELKGNLCEGLCKTGPNIKIEGQVFSNLTPASLVALLDEHFKGEKY